MIGGSDPAAAQLAVTRFRREAETAASLRSPHTVELYDFGVTDDQTLYFVMELLEGVNLDSLVRRHGPLTPHEKRAWPDRVQTGRSMRSAVASENKPSITGQRCEVCARSLTRSDALLKKNCEWMRALDVLSGVHWARSATLRSEAHYRLTDGPAIVPLSPSARPGPRHRSSPAIRSRIPVHHLVATK